MRCKSNLFVGAWCIFIGVANLLISIDNNIVINPIGYTIGLICCALGALNIGIWVGRN